ncbi:MAG: hypothetical protein ACM3SR_12965 [Ignavibacteriales bacterium]
MDIKRRIANLEAALVRDKVHWNLQDGTRVEVYFDDVMDCFLATMRKRPHWLLGQILNADPETSRGCGSFLQLIQVVCKSRERGVSYDA